MLALTVATAAAAAADLQAHVGVSFAAGKFLSSDDVEPFRPTRVEVGGGTADVQGYLTAQFTILNAPSIEIAAAAGLPARLAGDALLTQLGAGVRGPVRLFGRAELVPHAELGLAVVDTPIAPEVVAEEFPGVGVDPVVVGAFVQTGVDVGVALVPDRVVLAIGPEVGWLLVADLGLTVGVRVTAAARF